VIFECVGAQNDQFVQEALDYENAFELFMRIMNDPQCPARFLRPRAPCTNFSRGSLREFRGKVMRAAMALIADSATEGGLKVSAE
jgi:hypothetical protein